MMEVRIAHELAPEEAVSRVVAAAAEHGLELVRESPRTGTVAKVTPLGAVRGSFSAEEGALVIVVEERPAFLPEGVVRRAIEDALGGVLGA